MGTKDDENNPLKPLRHIRIHPVPIAVPLQPLSTPTPGFLELEATVLTMAAARAKHFRFKRQLLRNAMTSSRNTRLNINTFNNMRGRKDKDEKEDPITDPTPQTINDIWTYSIAQRAWLQPDPVALQPQPRWLHTAVVLENKMVIFGGSSNNLQLLSDLWTYDPEGNKWKEVPFTSDKAWPTPREGHSAVAIAGEMVVFGGVSYSYVPYNDQWKFSAAEGSFKEMAPFTNTGSMSEEKRKENNKLDRPEARWMHSATTVPGGNGPKKMIVFGGCSASYSALADTWIGVVEAEAISWLKVLKNPLQQSTPAARWLHAACAIPLPAFAGASPDAMAQENPAMDAVLLHGGSSNNAPQEDLWIFSLKDDQNIWIEVEEVGVSPWARSGHTATLVGKFANAGNDAGGAGGAGGGGTFRRRLLQA